MTERLPMTAHYAKHLADMDHALPTTGGVVAKALVPPAAFEPATCPLGKGCSILLSYGGPDARVYPARFRASISAGDRVGPSDAWRLPSPGAQPGRVPSQGRRQGGAALPPHPATASHSAEAQET